MKKRKYFIFLLIIGIVLFNNNFVLAANNVCTLKTTAETGIALRMELSASAKKYGYFYDLKLNNQQAFCLDLGKHARSNMTYFRGPKVNRNEMAMYYKIYDWYTKQSHSEALFEAQVMMWSFKENGRSLTVEKAAEALTSAYFNINCKDYVNALRGANYFNNPDFKCECFVHNKNSSAWNRNGCQDVNRSKKISSGRGSIEVAVGLDDYMQAIQNNQPNAYSAVSSSKRIIASRILNWSTLYEDDLYYWYPVNCPFSDENGNGINDECQDLIAPDPGECTGGGCESDLASLLNKYDASQRTTANASYYRELTNLQNKYSELDISNVTNPECLNCDEALLKYLGNYSVAERTAANATYYNGLKQLQNKYSELNIADLGNPKCGNNPPNPSCDAEFTENTCSFNVDEGGFYISDNGTASDGNSCYFSQDIAYTLDNGTAFSSIASDLSNDYCTLKCWEEFEGKFPAAIRDIKAGTKFFWGKNVADGHLGSLKAVRYCSTTFIDYGKFGRDFDINEGEVSSAYNSYVAQKTYNESSANYTGSTCHTSETTRCVTEKTEYSCPNSHFHLENGRCLTYDDANTGLYTCISSSASHPCITNDVSPTVTKSCATCPSGYSVKDEDGKCHKDGKMYGKTSVTGATNNADVCVPNDKTDKTAYFNDYYNLSTELSNRKTAVQKEITDRKDLIADINACQSQNVVNSTSMYNYTSSVTLNYEDPRGIDRNITNPITLTATESRNVDDGGQHVGSLDKQCSSTPDINQYEGCNTTTGILTVQKYNEYHWNFTGEWKYKYDQENYFWYTVLENFEMINDKTYEDYEVGSVVPYVNGYGIPTAFSTITGFYDISIDVKGFGHNGHFDSLVQEKISTDIYNYACKYHVENKIYGNECVWDCDFVNQTCTLKVGSPEYCEREVRGLDIVYRLIEMPNNVNLETRRKTVFPSIDGDGRAPGENWEKFINEHTTGFTNVTSNNVVYDNNSAINTYGPIYEIELTPSAISQIREDTLSYRNTDKDPYTSYTDANNHEKVICKGDHTERTCASNYITELIQSNIITGGYYLKCNSCRNNTNERLDWIDSQKERFY